MYRHVSANYWSFPFSFFFQLVGRFRSFLVIFGCFWLFSVGQSFLLILGRFQLFLVVLGCFLLFLVVFSQLFIFGRLVLFGHFIHFQLFFICFKVLGCFICSRSFYFVLWRYPLFLVVLSSFWSELVTFGCYLSFSIVFSWFWLFLVIFSCFWLFLFFSVVL